MEVYYTKDSGFSDEVPLIPAVVSVTVGENTGGSWPWTLTFTEAAFDAATQTVVARKSGGGREFSVPVRLYSGWSDPIPGIHSFIYALPYLESFDGGATLSVDEETTEFWMQAQAINEKTARVHVKRTGEEGRPTNRDCEHHVVVATENLFTALRGAYLEFGKTGGWDDFYFEEPSEAYIQDDEDDETPTVVVDGTVV